MHRLRDLGDPVDATPGVAGGYRLGFGAALGRRKALVGILRVSSGRVLVADADVTNRQPEDIARAGVGYVPRLTTCSRR